MVRTVHSIYRVLLTCLPKEWEIRPRLVWHWDSISLAKHCEINPEEFERENGFPLSQIGAMLDLDGDCIHAPMGLVDGQLSKIIFTFLHELAHANVSMDNEKVADDEALKVFKSLNRKAKWKELDIKLGTRRLGKTAIPDDKVYSRPTRLPVYQPNWVVERYA